jgi:hypothetical protein
MDTSSKVRLGEDSPDDRAVLVCPCGGEYLHHGGVVQYLRDREDGPTVSVLTQGSDGMAVIGGQNPSGRRDAIGVWFRCEDCDSRRELCIEQHKGRTFLRWRDG